MSVGERDQTNFVMTPEIHHNPAESRFEATVQAQSCVVDYRLHGNVMTITRTYVPPLLEGRGIAAALVAAALAHARASGLRVRPACSYVARYLHRHPEAHDLLAP
jgi:predicted GNAT family acetyltransferase